MFGCDRNGQTGAGKSYSMMGAAGPGNEGIISRATRQLFEAMGRFPNPNTTFSVEVSYLEIYNETVLTRSFFCLFEGYYISFLSFFSFFLLIFLLNFFFDFLCGF